MSGQPSEAVKQAMQEVMAGTATPYAAAKANNIALSTIYRSSLYRKWKEEQANKPPPKQAKRR